MSTELACEMVGGPFDGEVRQIVTGPDGLPLAEIRWAQMTVDRWALLNFDDPVETRYSVALYERGNISDDTHRWRYHFRGIRTFPWMFPWWAYR